MADAAVSATRVCVVWVGLWLGTFRGNQWAVLPIYDPGPLPPYLSLLLVSGWYLQPNRPLATSLGLVATCQNQTGHVLGGRTLPPFDELRTVEALPYYDVPAIAT